MAHKELDFFDKTYPENEQFPRRFDVHFEEISARPSGKVRLTIRGEQVGDIVTDNSYEEDCYRFHDVFHLSYVAILGWSPCVRNMLRIKRKSVPTVDEVEDGARAIITEEAISLLVFNYAKHQNLFMDGDKIDPILLETIGKLVGDFEVKTRTSDAWQRAILKGYEVFRKLVENRGGVVHVDMGERSLTFTEH
jgi:hypothetical protein